MKRDPTRRWLMPSTYHARYFEQDGIKIYMVVLDTWRLVGGDTVFGFDSIKNQTWIRSREALQQAVGEEEISQSAASLIEQKFVFDPYRMTIADHAQYDWLELCLTTKSALESDWRIVMGHYPIYSASKNEHGDTKVLIDDLDKILRKYNVDAYFSGHDHVLQVIAKDSNLHYYGSGAGAKKISDVQKHYGGLKGYFSGSYGFMKHVAKKDSLTTKFIVTDGAGKGKESPFEYVQYKNKKKSVNDDVIMSEA